MKTAKKLKWTFIGISLAMMILGLCLVIWPYISAKVLCYLFGVLILITGIVRIVCYTRRGVSAFFHYYEFPLGLLDILLAVFFFSRSQHVILVLPIVIGIMIMIDSIFKLQMAIDLKRLGLRKWWSMLLLSILSILFSFLLILDPFEGSMTLMIFIGLSLIVDSIQSFCSVIYASKYIRKKQPIDVDYIEVE
ncbi:MAG: HdeD family acid-resistance protein [Agathobacter sp.]